MSDSNAEKIIQELKRIVNSLNGINNLLNAISYSLGILATDYLRETKK